MQIISCRTCRTVSLAAGRWIGVRLGRPRYARARGRPPEEDDASSLRLEAILHEDAQLHAQRLPPSIGAASSSRALAASWRGRRSRPALPTSSSSSHRVIAAQQRRLGVALGAKRAPSCRIFYSIPLPLYFQQNFASLFAKSFTPGTPSKNRTKKRLLIIEIKYNSPRDIFGFTIITVTKLKCLSL